MFIKIHKMFGRKLIFFSFDIKNMSVTYTNPLFGDMRAKNKITVEN